MADFFASISGLLGGGAATVRKRIRDMADGTWAEVIATAWTPYPTGATALIAGSGNVANASAAATLTPASGKTAYISGFQVSGSGATAALPVTVTVAGLLGGTRSFTYGFAAGALVSNQPLVVSFNPPLPASAIDTAIVVTCPASGAGGTNNTVVAEGFSL